MCSVLGGHREVKNGAAGLVGGHPQTAAMGFYDRTADRQPHPQTAGLRRVERVEEALETRRGHAWPRILHRDQHAIRFSWRGSDEQLSRPFYDYAHGLDSVDDEIEGDLLQLYAISFCISRTRRSLSRASASARLRSVRSSTKATPWSRCSSNAAEPISTGTRLPSLRKYSFSTGGNRPAIFSPATARASRSRHSGGVRSAQLTRPARRSSRSYPTMRRKVSLASMIRPSRSQR